MDYRDALACNKFIIEAKRHGDYHQTARAKILSVAIAKYNSLKRQEIDNKAQAAVAEGKYSDKDEAKLRVIMSEDDDMARLYQEAYGDVKADKEHDYNESVRIHDKYSYLYDRDSLDDKVPTNKYNVQDEKPTIEEEIMTTELSDEELDLVYKRYKLMQAENNDFMRDADEEANELIQKYNANAAKS
jgi:hypothetical protein